MSRGQRLTAGAAAVMLAALAATGCGSSAVSPFQLRSRATRACARVNRELGRISTPAGEAGGLTFLKHGAAVLAPELRRLRRLSTSDQTAAGVYQSALGALAAELAAVRHAEAEIRAGEDPVRAFRTLQQSLAPLESAANGAWQALQIPGCLNR